MSRSRILPIVLATLGGVAIGWVIKPIATRAGTAKETSGPVLKREARRAGNEDSRIAARWMDRMASDDFDQMAKAVPPGEIKTVINGMMESIWGSLSDADVSRIQLLISEWVEKDPEGALAWARSLPHPQQRELGLTCIASAIGQSDLEKGFEIYAELDKVTVRGNAGVIYSVVTRAYTNAAKLGPEALLDVVKRTPASEDRWSMGIGIKYPPDFDFSAMMDGMTEAGLFKSKDPVTKPYTLSGVLAEWALRDRDAAFAYLAEHAKEGTAYPFYELEKKIAETQGTPQAQAWLGEKLVALDSAQRQELVKGSMLGAGDEYLNNYVLTMPTEEAATEFRYDILQATGEFGYGRNYGILKEMQEMEDRLAVIERLQNIKHTEPLVEQLKQWNVPQERIDGIVEKVKRKE